MPLDENARCTVCIPTYNQAEYLREAIESVARQTVPVRLIVSNDASPDNTSEVLGELQARYRFQATNHAVNLGISENVRWLLRQAETPLIMRLDSDDRLRPEYIDQLSRWLDRFPEAGYAHCAIQEIDRRGEMLHERRLARAEGYQEPDAALKRLVNGYQVAANLLLFRRDALTAVDFGATSGKIDMVEDYDLSVRLADVGWGNVYSAKILGEYRIWTGTSRPAVDRKLKELRGLKQIFSGSLREAFTRRGWSPKPLERRRVHLALASSEMLDRAGITPEERRALVQALQDLAGTGTIRWLLGPGLWPRLMRRSMAAAGSLHLLARRVLKRLILRR